MAVNLKISDPERYGSQVKKVVFDLEAMDQETFTGSLCIYLQDNKVVPFYGLIEATDYEDTYGFVFQCDEVKTALV